LSLAKKLVSSTKHECWCISEESMRALAENLAFRPGLAGNLVALPRPGLKATEEEVEAAAPMPARLGLKIVLAEDRLKMALAEGGLNTVLVEGGLKIALEEEG
jgi:hypothetical protein